MRREEFLEARGWKKRWWSWRVELEVLERRMYQVLEWAEGQRAVQDSGCAPAVSVCPAGHPVRFG